jgi:hypothetical protein
VLDKGVCSYLGTPAGAVAHYLQATVGAEGSISYADQPAETDAAAEVLALAYRTGDGAELTCAKADDALLVEITLRVNRRLPQAAVQVALRHVGGELFISMNSQQRNVFYDLRPGVQHITLRLPALPVASGSYYAQVRIWDAAACKLVRETPFRYPLQVDDDGNGTGMLALPHAWGNVIPGEASVPARSSAPALEAVCP